VRGRKPMSHRRVSCRSREIFLVGSSSGGDYVQTVAPDTFVVDHFPNSSRLRVDLPVLAGEAFMEFNTKGTEAGINKAQCK
jgi:hypothetical protein